MFFFLKIVRCKKIKCILIILFLFYYFYFKHLACKKELPLKRYIPSYCRDSALQVETDQVRILLFRECEWRGRKLLFDSMMVQKHRSKSETMCTTVNNAEGKYETSFNIGTAHDFEVIIELRILIIIKQMDYKLKLNQIIFNM